MGNADLLVLHELQNDQKCHNDLFPAVLRLKHLPEISMRMGCQISPDIEFFVCDTDLFPLYFAKAASNGIHPVLLALKHFREYILKVLKGPVPDQFLIVDGRHIASDFFGKVLGAEIAHSRVPSLFPEFLRHVFIHLVLEKPLDEFVPRIFLFTVLILLLGKKHPALDIQECRSHDQKLAGHVHVIVFHLPHVFQILICDRHDRNIVYIDFVLFDQMHKEVHRPLKHLKL